MKVRAWTSLLVVSMVVAAVLAVVSLSWKTGPTAAQPLFRMFVDANTGDGICDLPPDSDLTVPHPTSFNVAVCVQDPPAALGSFAVEVVYDDGIIRAPEVANSGTGLDDNPNANQAALGGGWDCSGFGLAYPTGDVDPASGAGAGRAKMNCLSLVGPWTFTSTGSVALVSFNTQGPSGTSSLTLTNALLGDVAAAEIGGCNPVVAVPMPCVDGSVTVPGSTSPPTPAGTATPTPAIIPTGTITPTPFPFACRWEDDFGRGTRLDIQTNNNWQFFNGADIVASGSGARPIGASKFVSSRSGGITVFGFGRCPAAPGPGGPARAFVMDMSGFPFRMFRLTDVSG